LQEVLVQDQTVIDTLLQPAAEPAPENRYRCAVRLANVRDVRVEHCRMMSEVGILSVFGLEWPSVPQTDLPGEPPGPAGTTETISTFNGLETGSQFTAGQTFTDPDSGVAFTIQGRRGQTAFIEHMGEPR
jgi:hypothetical protein